MSKWRAITRAFPRAHCYMTVSALKVPARVWEKIFRGPSSVKDRISHDPISNLKFSSADFSFTFIVYFSCTFHTIRHTSHISGLWMRWTTASKPRFSHLRSCESGYRRTRRRPILIEPCHSSAVSATLTCTSELTIVNWRGSSEASVVPVESADRCLAFVLWREHWPCTEHHKTYGCSKLNSAHRVPRAVHRGISPPSQPPVTCATSPPAGEDIFVGIVGHRLWTVDRWCERGGRSRRLLARWYNSFLSETGASIVLIAFALGR